jgi:hypothetical protein
MATLRDVSGIAGPWPRGVNTFAADLCTVVADQRQKV